MDPIRWKQIDSLVDEALEIPEPDRAAFVADKANGDKDLERAVLELLAAQGKTNEFLNQSAMRLMADVIGKEFAGPRTESLVGKTISTYRVEKLLGAGGMGEVYLAFDHKMKRKVALKILSAEYGSHDDRVKRFEIEARAISRINHPNIVTIYDVGNAEGVNFIATEYVDGKTIRELLGGKFKLRNVMANSMQICDALSAAHEVGVIHRDIKPENIMIRKDGYAKILDFGVAKLTESDLDMSRNFGQTTRGMIIGTPAYMSPAQVSGELIDHRSDIWGCGVVLYEFLTGTNPFKGKNRTETFEAILSKNAEPASSVNPDLPPDIDQIFEKLFSKDPADGYQTAADLRADLRSIKRELDSNATAGSGEFTAFGTPTKRSSWIPKLAVATVAIALVGLIAFFGFFNRTKAPAGTDWTAAQNLQLTNQPGTEFFPSLSPDGKDIVYAARENDSYEIFSLRVGSRRPQNLTNSPNSNDTMPAFSPDGNSIAFRSNRDNGGIFVMDASGENPKRIADFGFHPSWSPDGKEIVVSTFGRDQPTVRTSAAERLVVIDVASGKSRDILSAEATFPAWSPNGHRIAYWFYTGTYGRRDIATIPASGGEPVIIAKDFAVSNWNPVWSPDGKFLYFVSSRSGNMNFWRIAIDEMTGDTIGEPEPVVTPSTFSRHATFSRDGRRMAYVQTNNTANLRGLDFDMRSLLPVGDAFAITVGDREAGRSELSPDGSTFVMRLARRNQDDIVTVSRDGRDWRDVTNDEPFDRFVRWSPDGKRIAFFSDRENGGQIWISNSDGTGRYAFTNNPPAEFATGFPVWSPDGQLAIHFNGNTLIYSGEGTAAEQEPLVLPRVPNTRRIVIWDWSADGKKLVGVMNTNELKHHLVVFSFETNEFEIILKDSDSVPAWLPDSRHIILTKGNSISLVDSVTKTTRKIYEDRTLDIRSPYISRDGKLLYFIGASLESDIWMLDLQ